MLWTPAILLFSCCLLIFPLLMLRVNGFRSVLNRAAFSRLQSQHQGRSTYTKAFAGKPFVIDKDILINTLKKFGTDIREKPDGQFELRECKLCNKKNRDKPDNIYKLNVWPSGSFNCFRCSCSGNWNDLKLKAEQYASGTLAVHEDDVKVFKVKGSVNPATLKEPGQPVTYVIPNQAISYKPYSNLFPSESRLNARKESEMDIAHRQQVRDYLNKVRGLSDEVLQRYGVGYTVLDFLSAENNWEPKVCISFPWEVRPHYLHGKLTKYTQPDDAHSTKDALIIRSKFRALETKGLQRIQPKGGMWGFFGWHTVPYTEGSGGMVEGSGAEVDVAAGEAMPPVPSCKEIIITEGEYDAMAVSQALSALPESDPLRQVPAISLPNGCNSLPTELIPLLAPFEKIYLWLDHDQSGQEAATKFVSKLGATRCAVVTPRTDTSSETQQSPPKDANDALRQDPALIPAMLRAARVATRELYTSFADERAFIMPKIARSSLREGSQSTSLPLLSKICKGFRRGELVVFTGPTGSGKTTLLSQLGLDFAQQAKPVLWGSFEQRPRALMAKMVQQSHKGRKLSELSESALNKVANDFQALPIKFLNFHEAKGIDQVMEAMEHAVYTDEVQHIIIDNLQFMMPPPSATSLTSADDSGSTSANGGDGANEHSAVEDDVPDASRSAEPNGATSSTSSRGTVAQRQMQSQSQERKFELQDLAVARLRRFASDKDVNIILVIHPRREEEDVRLTMNSIFGSAKATQEADLVMILQRVHGRRYLDIKKNRYDGETGKVDVAFNPVSGCYEDFTSEGYKALKERERELKEQLEREEGSGSSGAGRNGDGDGDGDGSSDQGSIGGGGEHSSKETPSLSTHIVPAAAPVTTSTSSRNADATVLMSNNLASATSVANTATPVAAGAKRYARTPRATTTTSPSVDATAAPTVHGDGSSTTSTNSLDIAAAPPAKRTYTYKKAGGASRKTSAAQLAALALLEREQHASQPIVWDQELKLHATAGEGSSGSGGETEVSGGGGGGSSDSGSISEVAKGSNAFIGVDSSTTIAATVAPTENPVAANTGYKYKPRRKPEPKIAAADSAL